MVKLKNEAIKRADELSAATNGRRFYVLPVYDDFVIVDSAKWKQWLKDNHFNSAITLSAACVYYTPVSNLCRNNTKDTGNTGWFANWIEGLKLLLHKIGFKLR